LLGKCETGDLWLVHNEDGSLRARLCFVAAENEYPNYLEISPGGSQTWRFKFANFQYGFEYRPPCDLFNPPQACACQLS
jgi:hypothetical protein